MRFNFIRPQSSYRTGRRTPANQRMQLTTIIALLAGLLGWALNPSPAHALSASPPPTPTPTEAPAQTPPPPTAATDAPAPTNTTAATGTPASASAASPATSERPVWNQKMSELKTAFSEIIPFLFSPSKFSDPAKREFLGERIHKIENLAHVIDQHAAKKSLHAAPDVDPALRFVSRAFKDEVEHAAQVFTLGHAEFARSVLQSSLTYCMACHTRTSSGPQFSFDPMQQEISGLRPIERMNLFVATRQFDAALAEYQKQFAAKKSTPSMFDRVRATRVALAIAVRVKKDQNEALKIVAGLLKTPGLPKSYQEDAEAWKSALGKWKKEKNRSAPASDMESLKLARELVKEGQKMQEFPIDAKGDVYYLRASSLLHEHLNRYPMGSTIPEALYLSGISYETLQDIGFWSLHELYYEGCIEKAPHTEISQKCYKRYEDSIIAGYSGSRGISIPGPVRQRLNTLKAKAMEKAK